MRKTLHWELLGRDSKVFKVAVSSIFSLNESLEATKMGKVPTAKMRPKLRALLAIADHC